MNFRLTYSSMWPHYRKWLIPNQLFIIAMCVSAYFWFQIPLPQTIIIFIAMQIGAFIGSWWGGLMKSRLDAAKDRLPLER